MLNPALPEVAGRRLSSPEWRGQHGPSACGYWTMRRKVPPVGKENGVPLPGGPGKNDESRLPLSGRLFLPLFALSGRCKQGMTFRKTPGPESLEKEGNSPQ